MHRNPLTIAIDGPSGSGKSSVSKSVARELGLAYLDTGAMYRALAWWVLERGLDPQDHAVIAQAARDLPLEISTDPGEATVRVDGTDITTDIRTTRISSRVSAVASNLDVRAELASRQRALITQARTEHGGMVAEGRDITTVVAPDAEHRILLTASEEARLARRATELHGSAAAEALDATKDQIIRRDRDDAAVSAFFEPAKGVVGVDTSDLSFEQSVQAVLDVVRGKVSTPTSPLQRTLPTERDRET
ncbi:MAG: (d)CMP kinase [Ornithinimicrobium sp.]|uniref:(d)CMP kinase n=1 Tax=Ornithinimicrobium sp. TaxID=1977084 RepID=UPI0026E02F66|nr:(d)CMP kinase [Ornithinimicrobium sp.]MDO5740901.1 (d)CMP kinase [Ornithinimicrobium sp.]